jgi:hypothetical protein
MPIDPRDFLEFPENTSTSFIFSFNCQPKPSLTQEKEIASHPHQLIKEAKSSSSIGIHRSESMLSDIFMPDVGPSATFSHSRLSSTTNQYPAASIQRPSQVAMPPLDRRISATSSTSSSELSKSCYSDDDLPGVYAAVTPCECQLIRQLQLIHRYD